MLSEVSLDTLHSTYIPLISITGFIDYWTILRNLPVKQLTNYDRKFQSLFKGVERQSDYTNKNKCQIPVFAFIFNFFVFEEKLNWPRYMSTLGSAKQNTIHYIGLLWYLNIVIYIKSIAWNWHANEIFPYNGNVLY